MMIPILSIAIRKDYQKVRDATHQVIFDKQKAYMRKRRERFVSACENEFIRLCDDENQLQAMKATVAFAIAHYPDTEQLARFTIEAIDDIVYKKTEVKS
jgi:hypothetical protein